MPLTHPSGKVDAQKSSWMETLGPSAHISSRNSFLHYRSCPTEAMALNHPGSVGSGLEGPGVIPPILSHLELYFQYQLSNTPQEGQSLK